ncbi:MAG: hypothetical protein KAS30_03560 [Candidatus Diapherotrites archaeon]|nr:hypothetical protein [Candidatus Diapherotrites archaeon]
MEAPFKLLIAAVVAATVLSLFIVMYTNASEKPLFEKINEKNSSYSKNYSKIMSNDLLSEAYVSAISSGKCTETTGLLDCMKTLEDEVNKSSISIDDGTLKEIDWLLECNKLLELIVLECGPSGSEEHCMKTRDLFVTQNCLEEQA